MHSNRPSPKETTVEKTGRERRRGARASADLPLTVALAGGKSEARVRDISRAGVCFFLDRPIPMMTVLEIVLSMRGTDGTRGTRTVAGRGAVVRCEKISKAVEHYEIAVFLHEMSEADRGAIEAYVAAAKPLRDQGA